MADCTYRFKDAAGKDVTISGKAALVEGGLDHLLPGGVLIPAVEQSEQAKPEAADVKFSCHEVTGSLHPKDAKAALAIARKAFPGVQINLHDKNMAETVPLPLRDQIEQENAVGDVKGAFCKGEVHLFRAEIPGIKSFETTVAHEMTHAGLSARFGPELDEAMLHINRSNAEVAAWAQELQGHYGYSVAHSTEEALADMGGNMVRVKGFDRLVAVIREWLRKHGFVSRWTNNDVANLVMTARSYARDPKAPMIYRETVFLWEGKAAERALSTLHGMKRKAIKADNVEHVKVVDSQ